MTENKRFIASSGGVYDLYKRDRFVWSEWEDITQIMNNLNEKAIERSKALSKLQKENKQLKKDNKEYIRGLELKKAECQSWASDVRELREQNCQLEKEIKQLKSDNRLLYSRNTDLKRKNELYDAENEQLKSKNKILKEDLEHCANQFTDDGKNVLLNLR